MGNESKQLLTPESDALFDRIREDIALTGWNLGSVDEAKHVLRSVISDAEYSENSAVVQSRAEILKGWRYLEYWFFEGAPLSVQIACYVGLKAGLLIAPKDSAQRVNEFFAFFEQQIAFKVALNQSETVGGWLFPGEPELFWEVTQRVAKVPGDLCEIGSWLGRSTILLASACSTLSPEKKLHVIDDWNYGGQPETYPYLTANRRLKEEFDQNLRPWQSILTVHQGAFHTVHPDLGAACKDGFSFIFHDAGHTPQDFMRDLPLIESLLNSRGVLLIHDYAWEPFGESREVIDRWISANERFTMEKIVGWCAVIGSK